MRKISANYVFPVSHPPIKNGIIVLDEENRITEIKSPENELREEAGVEFYNGVLVPGFVNCHCHLELSAFRDKIKPGLGMVGFIEELRTLRATSSDNDTFAMEHAHREMKRAGIALTGDVANTTDTIQTKKMKGVEYITFIEVFGLNPDDNDKKCEQAFHMRDEFNRNGLDAALVPHAIYSVNELLFRQLIEKNNTSILPLTFHHMESKSEYEFVTKDTGKLRNLMESINKSHPVRQERLNTYDFLSNLKSDKNILLVHNTWLDLYLSEKLRKYMNQIFWVLCPSSNRFIHNNFPPLPLIDSLSNQICLGTDSLASNTHLSILNEMMMIQNQCPGFSFEKILEWATQTGAKALGRDNIYGSFEIGKSPGVNLLSPFNFEKMTPKKNTRVQRLV